MSLTRPRFLVRSVALSAGAALALTLAACGSGDAVSDAGGSASGDAASPSAQALNDGAGIPTKALSSADAAQRLLAKAEFPGGTVKAVKAKDLKVGTEVVAPVTFGSLTVADACETSVAALKKATVPSVAGAVVTATLDPSVAPNGGSATITLYAGNGNDPLATALQAVSDACSGTVAAPATIAPVARGLQGLSIDATGTGEDALTVAAGDWGANHLLVVVDGGSADVAQQIIDAQLAKLSSAGA